MTTEEKRIKIAESRGVFAPKSCLINGLNSVPDYFNDLNAMHSAEGQWIESARSEYERNERAVILEIAIVRVMMSDRKVIPPSYRATAAQRAEAFGRTLNLWTE